MFVLQGILGAHVLNYIMDVAAIHAKMIRDVFQRRMTQVTSLVNVIMNRHFQVSSHESCNLHNNYVMHGTMFSNLSSA